MTILTIGLVALFYLRRDKRNSILIWGLPNSGKTLLYYQLRDGLFRETVSSSIANSGTFSLFDDPKMKPINIIDQPGFRQLRGQVDSLLPSARGVIFLIDSVEFPREANDVAEYIYYLLVHPEINKNGTKLHLVFNKSEMVTAMNESSILTELENRLLQIRESRKATGTSEQEEEEVTLGVEGQSLKLRDLPIPISWSHNSVKKREVEQITHFIQSLF
eukprot:TRINITY_DN1246_c0_g1_i1.p1 TRINITY_DN1246_c0_g1~~TRINITY_DN1246_c0_g1_i1.p1  ORF type:complete len:250 (-),score=48.60 TRINITY_DN1246_c0_g1_i1:159-812(-)